MALVKSTLKNNIYNGLYKIFIAQSNKATLGDENENPEDVIEKVASDMATVISDAIDDYVKSGDISVGPSHIAVSSPAGSCTVVSISPAKIE